MVPKTDKQFIYISAGTYHPLGLLEDGSILAWGDNVHGQATVPKIDKKFIAISAGYWHSLGLLENGSVLVGVLINMDKQQYPKQIKNLSFFWELNFVQYILPLI